MNGLAIMIMCLVIIVFVAAVYWAISCYEPPRNEENSSALVHCIANDRCRDRHTELCKNCKHNHYEPPKSYYEPKEEEE